jgi:hypothetical protein
MKKIIGYFIPILLIGNSCTKVVYTSRDYVKKFSTKQDVIARFGLPTEKRSEGNITEWLYDFGSESVGIGTAYGSNRTTISGYGNTISGNSTLNGLVVTRFSNFQKYIKFSFNENDRVIGAQWNGVDFSEKKTKVGATIFSLLLIIGVGAALGLAATGGN